MGFLSRDELLGGFPARRASTLLFAIEGRVAQLIVEARQATARFPTERVAAAEERAFLAALARGRDAQAHLAIQDLEHYAPDWAALVAPDPNLRAALAHLLAGKYRFTARSAPRLRRALGLDDAAVGAAYARLYDRPIAAIYAPRLAPRERARWAWARLTHRLEDLPPFWTAFALTLTETVGAGILALPIALAEIGPLAGVVLLVTLGLLNIVTIAGISEAMAHNANVRYGHAYFGRVVADYLGRPGAAVLTLAVVGMGFLILPTYAIGLSTTLADITGLHAAIWAALLFLVQLYFLRRKGLNTTIASAIVVGLINIALLVAISLLALPHVSLQQLTFGHLPFVAGRPFEPGVLSLIFGVILTGYFGHLSTGACARLVLRREPSGRALIRGNIAAMVTVMILSALWVLAVNGAVGPADLAAETGTALAPLGALVGPAVTVCGLLFAVLSMGMASIHYALALANQVREWLPAPSGAPGRPLRDAWLGERGRGVIGILPAVVALAVAEAGLLTGRVSFAGLFWALGLIIPLLGGIFPVLMLAASRRKGDCAVDGAVGWVGRPGVLAMVYLVVLGGIFLHGLVIWQDPARRLVALGVGLLILGLTAVSIRRGAFTPRAVVELRTDRAGSGASHFSVRVDGKPSAADITLHDAAGERRVTGSAGGVGALDAVAAATFQLPASRARELKVWRHQVTADGQSRGLPARLELWCDGETRRAELGPETGQALLPLDGRDCRVRIELG